MDIKDVLKRENIVFSLSAKDKNEVIEKLVDVLYNNGYLTDKKAFKDDVMEREKASATGIGNGIAIPHGKSVYVKETTVAIARLDNQVEWESLDEKPVKFVILLAVNDNDRGSTHVKLLSMMARKLASEETCVNLTAAQDPDRILEIFSK